MNAMLKKLNNKRSGKKGFTLMEMLIVVAIIAILVAVAIPTFNGALDKARQSTDDANIRAAYAEQQVYDMMHTMDDTIKEPEIDGNTITFADGTTKYTLQYYGSVKTDSGRWTGEGGKSK